MPAPYFIATGMFKGVKAKFSWLFPILKEEKAATRIVRAIERNKPRLIMPWIVYTIWPLRLLPVPVFDFIAGIIMGIHAALDEFVKRK